MWTKLRKLFWNPDAVKELTAQRNARFAEIDAKYAADQAKLKTAKEINRETFRARLAQNTKDRDAALNAIR